MNQIVLASHGDMAKGMKHTIEMIFGPQDNLHWLSTTRDEQEGIDIRMRSLLATFAKDDDVYVLTDLLGGSVNNTMLALLKEYPAMNVVCGMNVPLALSLATTEEKLDGNQLNEMIKEAKNQIVNCNDMLLAADEEDDDL